MFKRTALSLLLANFAYADILYKTNYSYNNFDLPEKIQNLGQTGILSQFKYAYNKNLQLNYLMSDVGANPNLSLYSYDSQNRLVSNTEAASTTTYTFDLQSNLRSELSHQGNIHHVYNIAGQLIAITGPHHNIQINYDPLGSGNIIGDSSREIFSYNALDELSHYTDANNRLTAYRYDGRGERLSKQNSLGIQNFYYNAITLLNSQDPEQNQLTSYLFGNDREALIDGNQTSQFYFYNLHGDVVQVMDNAGNINQTYNYDVYGNGSNDINDINPIRYAGYVYDPESNLYYLNARYYNPNWQVFLSRDNTHNFDYTYANNNPVMQFDPSGHNPFANLPDELLIQIVSNAILTSETSDAYLLMSLTDWDQYTLKNLRLVNQLFKNITDSTPVKKNAILAKAETLKIKFAYERRRMHSAIDNPEQDWGENGLRFSVTIPTIFSEKITLLHLIEKNPEFQNSDSIQSALLAIPDSAGGLFNVYNKDRILDIEGTNAKKRRHKELATSEDYGWDYEDPNKIGIIKETDNTGAKKYKLDLGNIDELERGYEVSDEELP